MENAKPLGILLRQGELWSLITFPSLLVPAMAQRVTLRKRQPYNTTSNRRRVVKTPGGKLVYHHLKKPASAPKCGDCGIALPGVCSSLFSLKCTS